VYLNALCCSYNKQNLHLLLDAHKMHKNTVNDTQLWNFEADGIWYLVISKYLGLLKSFGM
jgi:hypothetical protein